ncbi:MAG: VOC family protein, partial [Actinobacteria bacterium]|nr:VOC family protein [Actinomycetota bacterium]
LRRVLTEEGTGCDAFGAGELEAALRGGVEPAAISLNGSSKDRALIGRAVEVGARLTLDSPAELELAREAAREQGRRAMVRLRVRPWLDHEEATGLAGATTTIQSAIQRYKPGIPTEQLLSLPAEVVAAPELEVRGLMAHIGRQSRDPAVWGSLGRWVGELCGELAARWEGWRPLEVDLGGGFPVPRDPYGTADEDPGVPRPPAPPLEAYAEAIAAGLRAGLAGGGLGGAGLRLEIEPGRSLYGNAGLHLTRVRGVKAQLDPVRRTWIETDTSEVFLADAVFERNRWNVIAADAVEAPCEQVADVVGISCNPDLIVADAALPSLRAGDCLAVLDTGAYQDANASNFNLMLRPATVLVHDAEAELIKRADRLEEILMRDRIPARLGGAGVQVLGLDHASVTCADLDRSLAFYTGLLGIRLMDRGEDDGPELQTISGQPVARVRWADLELGDGRVLELIEFERPRVEPVAAGNLYPGQGHISLRVADAGVAHAELARAGVEVRSAPVELGEDGFWGGCRCFYAVDPDGMTVELIERPT